MIDIENDVPDLEDLAAYLDGRLSNERRAQVEERLARDEDYYDVFMETVRFQEEQGQAEDGGKVITPAWWQNWKSIAPMAVAATLVLTIGLQSLSPSSPVALAGRLNPEAVVNSGVDWDLLGWWTRRGLENTAPSPDLLEEQQHAFRIGTRIADLQIALAAEDRETARDVAAELIELTRKVLVLSFFSDYYVDLRRAVTDGAEIDTLRKEAKNLEKQVVDMLDGPLAERFDLGAWNEVGRLAALSNDAKVLRKIWKRRNLAQDDIQEKIEPHYLALQQALESEENIDFRAAEVAFQKIARDFAGLG